MFCHTQLLTKTRCALLHTFGVRIINCLSVGVAQSRSPTATKFNPFGISRRSKPLAVFQRVDESVYHRAEGAGICV